MNAGGRRFEVGAPPPVPEPHQFVANVAILLAAKAARAGALVAAYPNR